MKTNNSQQSRAQRAYEVEQKRLMDAFKERIGYRKSENEAENCGLCGFKEIFENRCWHYDMRISVENICAKSFVDRLS